MSFQAYLDNIQAKTGVAPEEFLRLAREKGFADDTGIAKGVKATAVDLDVQSGASVSAALEAAGCKVNSFEPEDGKIEAKCTETATGKIWEIYIDPKTGAVSEVKADD